MLECVKNTVNIDAFDRFHFFDFFVNFEFPRLDFSCFLGAFWCPEDTLEDLREPLKQGGVEAGQAGWPGGSQDSKHLQIGG